MRTTTGVLMAAAVLCAACGGGAGDLSSKSWTKLDARPTGQFSSPVFDPQGHVDIVGFDDHHIYQFDLETRLWTDLGPFPIDNPAPPKLFLDGDGHVLGSEQMGDDTGLITAEIYQLGSDNTWTFLFEESTSVAYYFAADHTLWSVTGDEIDRGPIGGSAAPVLTLSSPSLDIDTTGRMLVDFTDGSGGRETAALSNTDASVTPLFTCGAVQQPYCLAHGAYYRSANDDLTFASVNDINNSQMFSLPSGSTTPVAGALFPTDRGDGFTTFNHSVSFGYDLSGNVYVTRSDNNGGIEVLYYLEYGASDFAEVLETPGTPDAVAVRPDGTLFLFDTGGSRDFYVLE